MNLSILGDYLSVIIVFGSIPFSSSSTSVIGHNIFYVSIFIFFTLFCLCLCKFIGVTGQDPGSVKSGKSGLSKLSITPLSLSYCAFSLLRSSINTYEHMTSITLTKVKSKKNQIFSKILVFKFIGLGSQKLP